MEQGGNKPAFLSPAPSLPPHDSSGHHAHDPQSLSARTAAWKMGPKPKARSAEGHCFFSWLLCPYGGALVPPAQPPSLLWALAQGQAALRACRGPESWPGGL